MLRWRAISRAWRSVANTASTSLAGSVWLVLLERVWLLAAAETSPALSGAAFAALTGWHCIVLMGLFGLGAVLCAFGNLWGRNTSSRWRRPEIGIALAVAAGCAPIAWEVGVALTNGEWISMQSYVGLVRAGIPVVAAPASGLAAWLVCKLFSRPASRAARLGALAMLAASVAATAADAFVMPGLHPAFHLSAYALAGVAAALGWRGALRTHTPPAPAWQLVPAAILWLAASTSLVTMSAATRAELLLRSPVAATLIRALFPPSPSSYVYQELVAIESEAVAEPEPATTTTTTTDELGIPPDANVILIVVDALRNDAVPPSRTLKVDTPFLRKWTRSAYRFTRVYAQSSRTHRSMPAMFASVEAYETPRGLSLPEYLAQADRTSAAVVNNFFVEPRYSAAQRLLEGFDYVEVYDKTEMDTMVDRALDLVKRIEDRPFFLWFHVYNMHAPGFDGELLYGTEGSARSRYKRSLKWLDGELERLVEGLSEPTRKRTVLILTADHGEGLGDNNVSQHGPTVFEEEVRVPLVIDIPGRRGKRINAVVGNIDLTPTLAELFALPANQSHRGHSLVPLLLDPKATWDASYYMENKDGLIVGLVDASDKIIYDVKADVFHRFDLAVDPKERVDRWGSDPALEVELRRQFVRKNPSPFRAELENPHTQQLLVRNLENHPATRVDESLRFLVRLAALQPNRPLVDAALNLFRTSSSRDVRLLLLSELFAADPDRWSSALVGHLESVAGTAEELEFIRGLANQGQPPFDPDFVAQRFTWWNAHGTSRDIATWLMLLRHWRSFSGDRFLALITQILARPDGDDDDDASTRLRALALQVLIAFDKPSGSVASRIEEEATSRLDDPSALVQTAAARLLGHLEADGATDKLSAVARDTDRGVRVRQAALHTVVSIQDEAAIPLVTELGDDPLLTVDAIDILRRLGSPDGLGFLRRVEEAHYNSLIRKRAHRAVETISGER